MKDINPKTPVGTRLLSRWARRYSTDAMTAVLVDFRSGERAFGSRRARPYEYDVEHICCDICAPDCQRKPYAHAAKRSEMNRRWRIADFSQVGFEGFGFEVTELAYKAGWSVVRACVGNHHMVWTYVGGNPYHVNDAALNWTRGEGR